MFDSGHVDSTAHLLKVESTSKWRENERGEKMREKRERGDTSGKVRSWEIDRGEIYFIFSSSFNFLFNLKTKH